MKLTHKIAGIIIAVGMSACGSTEKLTNQETVQSPLKLSTAGEVLTQTCSSYGCDAVLKERCGGDDFRILSQDTKNKYNSRKNQTTGGWDSSRTESVEIMFKCVSLPNP